ncbi:MAG TPA: PaaI family thioesterase [Acidimicrobiales bacterium]|nr:PaaI family thioesterase [Acidimicrobiales bacterium]
MGSRDMDRWLGDGGMELVGRLGATLERYGVDGEDLGWVEGRLEPTALAANPHGAVQAGVHAVVLDALMNFAINAALPEGDRTQGTIEMTTELLRPAVVGGTYALRGDVVRLARQVAHAEAVVTEPSGEVVSRASGTFLLARRG